MRFPAILDAASRTGRMRWSAVVVRVAVSAIVFAVLWIYADLGNAFRLVAGADLWPVAFAVFLMVVRVPLMAWRWRIILAKLDVTAPAGSLTSLLYISGFFGLALPSANANDLVRGVMLKQLRIPLGTGVASILVDRIYGVLSMAFLALPGALLLLHQGHHAATVSAVAITSVVMVAITVCVLPALHRLTNRPSQSTMLGRLSILQSLGGASRCFGWGCIAACIAISLVSQIMAVIAVACAGASVHIAVEPASYLVFVPVVWLATSLPLTVSGLGIREAGFAFLFQMVGVAHAQGLAIGAVSSATTIVAGVLGGVALLMPARHKKPELCP